MKKLLLFLALVIAAGVGWAIYSRSTPPNVPFAKAQRGTLISTLQTNGRVEPVEYAVVRAEREGVVERVGVEKGQQIAPGTVLLQLDTRASQADLAAAESRIVQAHAELETLGRGGRATELAEIESGLASAQSTLRTAQRDLETSRRLAAKNATPQREVRDNEQRVEAAQLQIQSFERRRTALVVPGDTTAAQARLRDAEAAATAARRRIELGVIRSPMAGTLYAFDVRTGAYLNPGDLVANVGKLARVRVTLYVDEPELGRVAAGMPVTITWDALPNRNWQGTVEHVPTQVVPYQTRQVGEVTCLIDNPGQELLPGTNINGEVRSRVVERALSIPREALRKEAGVTGVYSLQGNSLVWRPIKQGITSLTRTEVVSGLNEGDPIALPVDQPLRSGQLVTPVFPQ